MPDTRNPYGSIGHRITMGSARDAHGEGGGAGRESSLIPAGYMQAAPYMSGNGPWHIEDPSQLKYDERVGWITPIDNYNHIAPDTDNGWGSFFRDAVSGGALIPLTLGLGGGLIAGTLGEAAGVGTSAFAGGTATGEALGATG